MQLAFDKDYFNRLDVLNVMALENDGTTYIVDKEVHQAVSGTYLSDIDGLLSLNEIQHLPGQKLAISFNGSNIQVDELDVKVVGRVALVIKKYKLEIVISTNRVTDDEVNHLRQKNRR